VMAKDLNLDRTANKVKIVKMVHKANSKITDKANNLVESRPVSRVISRVKT
jgi:hypothetical protein